MSHSARVIRASTGAVLLPQVTVAETTLERTVGLLRHQSLKAGEGMWINDTHSIHTWFMRFAIDVVYVDKSSHVCKIVRNIRPWRMSFAWGALHCLECAANSLPADLAVGELITWRDYMTVENGRAACLH